MRNLITRKKNKNAMKKQKKFADWKCVKDDNDKLRLFHDKLEAKITKHQKEDPNSHEWVCDGMSSSAKEIKSPFQKKEKAPWFRDDCDELKKATHQRNLASKRLCTHPSPLNALRFRHHRQKLKCLVEQSKAK